MENVKFFNQKHPIWITTIVLLINLISIGAKGQDMGWETIYSIPGRGEIQYRIYINDPQAKRSYWTTNVYVRSTFAESIRFTLNADVTDKNGQQKSNITINFGARTNKYDTGNDRGNPCDWTDFDNIHLDKLVIDGRTVIENGQKSTSTANGLKW